MEKLTVFSPFDGHVIAELPLNSHEDAEHALATAANLYHNRDSWLPKAKRISILQKTYQLLHEREDALAKQAAEEGGKPLVDSKIEAARAASSIKVAIECMSMQVGEQIPMQINSASENRIAFTLQEPIGVVLAISAFNHPLNLIAHQVIPAIATGCPVIVKPALKTPLSCLALVEILYEAGLPKEWCQVLLCHTEIAEKMVSDPRISFLSFIGSSKVGWMLRSKLPPGAGCTLEHGGAAPVILEKDANLDDAIPLIVKGGLYHAGQVCVSVQRVFVHHTLCDEVATRIVQDAKKQIVGDPLDPNTQIGPLIDPKEVVRIHHWVEDAVSAGATLLCGGKQLSNTCYEPTVLLNPPDNARVSQEEIFGPVICIYSYENRLEAIERANQPFFCFQAAIFTQNIDIALDTLQRLNATTVMINDHTAFRVDWMPFGGRKNSGLGVGGIPYSIRELTANKLAVIRSQVL